MGKKRLARPPGLDDEQIGRGLRLQGLNRAHDATRVDRGVSVQHAPVSCSLVDCLDGLRAVAICLYVDVRHHDRLVRPTGVGGYVRRGIH